MADRPFDRTIVNLRERPISSDVNQLQSQMDRSLREVVQRMLGARASNFSKADSYATGFIGNGFAVSSASPAAMQVVIKAGLGFVYDVADVPSSIDSIVGLDDLNPFKPVSLLADQTINVLAADGANPRIDIVEVKANRQTNNPLSRDVLDPSSGAFVATSVDKTLQQASLDGQTSVNGSAAINYKTGTPAGAPVAPATTAGYIKIAQVLVGTGVLTLDDDVINDQRKLLFPGGCFPFGFKVSKNLGTSVITITQVVAPPGVLCLANPVSALRGNTGIELYVIAGGGLRAIQLSYSYDDGDATLSSAVNYMASRYSGTVVPDPTFVISSSEQSALNGALQTDPVKVAVGQVAARARLEASRIDSTDTFTSPFDYLVTGVAMV